MGTEMNREIPAVLTIAGSDSIGGAGIQADLKTMSAFRVYGMSVITAVTAQNTCGVSGTQGISGEMVRKQMESVMQDIPPRAVKIGMLFSAEAALAVAECLEIYRPAHLVLDPVMVSTSGSRLLQEDARRVLLERLFPLAELVTPNLPEAEEILGTTIDCRAAMEQAAEQMAREYGCAVLLKGGHLPDTADDLLYQDAPMWFPAQRIASTNTHGTGCTLSSAIACGLARGSSAAEAVGTAKAYVRGALAAGLEMGHGNGPVLHFWQEMENAQKL